MTDLDTQAAALYAAVPVSKPSWEQIPEGTQQVWRDAVMKGDPARFVARYSSDEFDRWQTAGGSLSKCIEIQFGEWA